LEEEGEQQIILLNSSIIIIHNNIVNAVLFSAPDPEATDARIPEEQLPRYVTTVISVPGKFFLKPNAVK